MSTPTATAEPHVTSLDARTHHLYRFFGQQGGLLYVGITVDLVTRFADHRKKTWWPEVASHTTETFPTRADALYAEAVAITGEAPRHNKDVPSLNRVDVLRSRATIPFAVITPEDRIRVLESQLCVANTRGRAAKSQLHQSQKANSRLSLQVAEFPVRVEGLTQELARSRETLRASMAMNTSLTEELESSSLKVALDEARRALETVHDLNKQLAEKLEAGQEARIFVVEAPRVADTHSQAAAPPVATAPPTPMRKSILQRLLGSA